MIQVTDTDISAVLVDGDWYNVTGVVVDFAEYTAGATTVTARGMWLAATVQGGPHNGHRIIVPLPSLDAVRT